MKNTFFTRLAAIGSAFALAFLVVQACGNPADLTKDVKLSVDNDLIRIPLSIQFLDPSVTGSGESADAQRDMKDVKIKVSFVGTNLNKLYTTTGQRLTNLTEIEGGQIDIAVKKTDLVDDGSNAINFSIIAEAPNYLRTVKSFSINDTITEFETFTMVNLTNAAQGINIKTASNVLSVTNGAVTATRDVVVADSAKVTVPAGTVLKDKNGNNLSGNLSVRLVQFSASDLISESAFPGSLNPTNVKDENGANLGAGTFTSLGFIDLDMDVNGTPVKQFGGNPISVTINVSPNLLNPDTGNPIQIGEVIPIWSLNETTGEWQREGTSTISGTAANLKVTFTQTHLSSWNTGLFQIRCKAKQRFNWSPDIPRGTYKVELMNGRTNKVIRRLQTLQINSNQLTSKYLDVFNLPNRSSMYFKITPRGRNIFCPGNENFVETQRFDCSLPASVVLTPNGPVSVNPEVGLIASGYCESNPNIIIRPTLSVWFRSPGCLFWSPLGTMRNGSLSTTAVETNQTYDFKVSVNGSTFYFYNKTIPQQANYVLPNIKIPPTYCNALF